MYIISGTPRDIAIKERKIENIKIKIIPLGSGYIHDCRISSDTKRLFSRQPFPMSKNLYTRLSLIKYKSVICTAAVSHTKKFIYTAAVHKV